MRSTKLFQAKLISHLTRHERYWTTVTPLNCKVYQIKPTVEPTKSEPPSRKVEHLTWSIVWWAELNKHIESNQPSEHQNLLSISQYSSFESPLSFSEQQLSQAFAQSIQTKPTSNQSESPSRKMLPTTWGVEPRKVDPSTTWCGAKLSCHWPLL